jgi:PRTRC genetic system protein A
MTTELVSHHFITDAKLTGQLYSYVVAGNGVFMAADRQGLIVKFPIAECEIRGLPKLDSYLNFSLPKVPAKYVAKMLELSMDNCAEGRMRETLFHLMWLEAEQRWRLDMPEQECAGASVRPLDDSPGSSYDLALIEVHSHHEMNAFFSSEDDADEQGFRIYGVLGEIFTDPKLKVRVGCYGQFWDVPADEVFEIPSMIEGVVPDGWAELEAAA